MPSRNIITALDLGLIQRFWTKFTKGADDQCWLWEQGKTAAGYGQINLGRVVYSAHRLSYMIHNGPIPKGMVICHKCDTPACVNPAHLFAGTDQDNYDDAITKGRQVRKVNRQFVPAPGFAEITEELVREVRADYAAAKGRLLRAPMGTIAKLCEKHKITIASFKDIVSMRSWRHVL